MRAWSGCRPAASSRAACASAAAASPWLRLLPLSPSAVSSNPQPAVSSSSSGPAQSGGCFPAADASRPARLQGHAHTGDWALQQWQQPSLERERCSARRDQA